MFLAPALLPHVLNLFIAMCANQEVMATEVYLDPPVPYKVFPAENLDALLLQLDAVLSVVVGTLSTATLTRRDFTETQVQTVASLFQALLDRVSAQDARIKQLETTANNTAFLAATIKLPGTCAHPSFTDNPSLQTLLNAFVCQIAGLQKDVASLKAGSVSSTELYLPHL